MYQKEVLGLEEAEKATRAAIEAAKKKGIAICVAVVDDHGDLVQFTRMNGATLAAISSAMNKAYTAAWVRNDTADYKKSLKASGDHAPTGDPRRTTVGGGVCIGRRIDPVTKMRSVLGAIGVGGGIEAEDEMFAKIGRDAVGLG